MTILNVMSKKMIIPTLIVLGSTAAANTVCQNNNMDGKNILEYMEKKPSTQASKAGILSFLGILGGKRRKEDETVNTKTETNDNEKNWHNIKCTLKSLPTDLYYEKENADAEIDALIEKLDKESVNRELGEYAIRGLKYIKEHSESIITSDFACNGVFIDEDSNNLFWSVFHSTGAALYPDLAISYPKFIELGKTYMDNNP